MPIPENGGESNTIGKGGCNLTDEQRANILSVFDPAKMLAQFDLTSQFEAIRATLKRFPYMGGDHVLTDADYKMAGVIPPLNCPRADGDDDEDSDDDPLDKTMSELGISDKGDAKQSKEDRRRSHYSALFERDKAGKIIKNYKNIEWAIESFGVSFKHNDFSNKGEIIGLPAFPELISEAVNHLRAEINKKWGILLPQELLKSATTEMEFAHRYHPVRDYIKSLNKWDELPRIDTWLIDLAGAEDTKFNRAVGRLFLIAAIRRVLVPGCKFDTMLILEGPQGWNKSTLARRLATRDDWFSDSMQLDADSKEAIEQQGGIWIAEIAELSGITKKDIDRVKAFLSRTTDRARPAYGDRRQDVPRQFVCLGTTNDENYLLDKENRRFWPVKIGKEIDIKRLDGCIHQLWAEAAHYEALGEALTLPRELWAEAEALQKSRMASNEFVGKLRSLVWDSNGWILSETLWGPDGLNIPTERRRTHLRAFGSALKELGFDRDQIEKKGDPRGPVDTGFYERGNALERQIELKLRGIDKPFDKEQGRRQS